MLGSALRELKDLPAAVAHGVADAAAATASALHAGRGAALARQDSALSSDMGSPTRERAGVWAGWAWGAA